MVVAVDGKILAIEIGYEGVLPAVVVDIGHEGKECVEQRPREEMQKEMADAEASAISRSA